jgi:small-conductance mechanosensitive channel
MLIRTENNGGGSNGGGGNNEEPNPDLLPESVQPENVEETVENVTSVNWWLEVAAPPLIRAAIIIAILLAFRWLLYRAIDRVVIGITTPKSRKEKAAAEEAAETDPADLTARLVMGDDVIAAQRRKLRGETVGTMLKSVVNALIMTLLVLLVLSQFGFDLAPLLAGAGIVGVALGFGAQAVVSDFLSGVFMLIEDQYGVGDIIDLGEASGTVEDVGLRVTRLRAVDGVVWYVRNGEVIRVGNMSQGWSRSILDVGVGYGEDVGRVSEIIDEVATGMALDEDWVDLFLERPEVLGLEDLAADSVVIRLSVKTTPGSQWAVSRQLRQRLKARFDAEGIEIPFPQRTIWVRNDGAALPDSMQADTGSSGTTGDTGDTREANDGGEDEG